MVNGIAPAAFWIPVPRFDTELCAEAIGQSAEPGGAHGCHISRSVDILEGAPSVTIHAAAQCLGWRKSCDGLRSIDFDGRHHRAHGIGVRDTSGTRQHLRGGGKCGQRDQQCLKA